MIVRSDRAALSYLRKAKELIAQQARWLDYVEQYDIEVRYRNGGSHHNADALSRRPCEAEGRCLQCHRAQGVELVQTRREADRGQCGQMNCRSGEVSLLSPLWTREADRHDQINRDPDQPPWEVDRSVYQEDRPLFIVGFPLGPDGRRNGGTPPDRQPGVECQITAVKTRQQTRSEQQKENGPQETQRYSSSFEYPSPILVREGDRSPGLANQQCDKTAVADGRELPMPIDVVLGTLPGKHQFVNDYAQHTVERMASAYELVRQHLAKTAEVCKARYDMKVRPVTFENGSLVWLYCLRRLPGTSAKWTRCYSGPYTVIRRVNDVNYVVQLSPRSRMQIVHLNKLKKYEQGPVNGVL